MVLLVKKAGRSIVQDSWWIALEIWKCDLQKLSNISPFGLLGEDER